MSYSDEPVLVSSTKRDYKRWIAVVAVLLLVGSILAIPAYNRWLEEQAHDVKRGDFQGAVYTETIEGAERRLELGWPGPRLGIVITPPPEAGATVRVRGRFGDETLAWNEEYKFFGPTKTEIDPWSHHRVRIDLQRDGRTVWSAKRWAWGVHDSHDGHGH